MLMRKPLTGLLMVRLFGDDTRGQRVLFVGDFVVGDAHRLSCQTVSAFTNHGQSCFDWVIASLNVGLKSDGVAKAIVKGLHIDDVGQSLKRRCCKGHLAASVTMHLHGLHCGRQRFVRPATQVGQASPGVRVQGIGAHIVVGGSGTHEGHAQALTGQKQCQRASHHTTASYANIE